MRMPAAANIKLEGFGHLMMIITTMTIALTAMDLARTAAMGSVIVSSNRNLAQRRKPFMLLQHACPVTCQSFGRQ